MKSYKLFIVVAVICLMGLTLTGCTKTGQESMSQDDVTRQTQEEELTTVDQAGTDSQALDATINSVDKTLEQMSADDFQQSDLSDDEFGL